MNVIRISEWAGRAGVQSKIPPTLAAKPWEAKPRGLERLGFTAARIPIITGRGSPEGPRQAGCVEFPTAELAIKRREFEQIGFPVGRIVERLARL